MKHRIARALSRTTTLTRVSALGCVVALALAIVPAVAGAQASSSSISSLRAAIDATANQWFAAQARADDLDRRIDGLDNALAVEQQKVARIRRIADRRAVQIYEDSTQGLDTMFGNDALELGRRAALVDQANSESQDAIDALGSSVADLDARRAELDRARRDLSKTLAELDAQRSTLDEQLSALLLRSGGGRTVLAADVGSSPIALAGAATGSAPVIETPSSAVAAAPVAAAPSPSNVGRVSSHHDDPFLVCTRAHESAGDYTVVDAGGDYYGAYQFAPTTWDVTASHAGRLDLVGVLPSTASEYDQDELAWSLYQWQGNDPWGGRC